MRSLVTGPDPAMQSASSGSKRNKRGELELWKSSLPLIGSQWKSYTFEIVGGVYFLRHKRHHVRL